MNIQPEFKLTDFLVPAKAKLDLHQHPTSIAPLYQSKRDYKKQLDTSIKSLQKLQETLYAHNRYSLLIIFQAMDAAGKDGAIRHVMSGINPQGCQVHSFKHPSATELEHDFLWRSYCALPERGQIGIFNRSYYEEVLIVKVQPELLTAQNLPYKRLHSNSFWRERYRSIVDSEAHLTRNGTRIIKFFLHISKEEQCQRFIDRINEPDKHWKFSNAEIAQRQHWSAYMDAYSQCLNNTSTTDAPWYVIPADDKKNARLIISTIINQTLNDLDLTYPEVTDVRRRELEGIREQLERGDI
ncbi:ADP-polyphosphate phosphotransferase [Cellvibrio sp. NN19]|uniref:ADP-polyphosphate phosphotransferase n=1 Tax=Cellvibrio chitinivorans TaxID=3102792 RepID=UPI002B404A11|nr:ADP-polyphosphate phosphotransferase [Cellvibrio sp. NN19]